MALEGDRSDWDDKNEGYEVDSFYNPPSSDEHSLYSYASTESSSDEEDYVDSNDSDDDSKDDNIDECGGSPMTKSTWPMTAVVDALAPLDEHFASTVGGTMEKKRRLLMVKRTAHLICFTASEKSVEITNARDTFVWLGLFVTTYFALLATWARYLASTELLAPPTILNYINDIVSPLKWFVYFSKQGADQGLHPVALQPLFTVAKTLRSNLSVLMKKRIAARTLEQEIIRRRMPEGSAADGLRRLQAIVNVHVLWATTLSADTIKNDKYSFCKFMKVFISSIYTFGGQGRVSGVKSLKFSSIPGILNKKYHTTPTFKTGFKYGYQVYI